jgi:hypothetical protein
MQQLQQQLQQQLHLFSMVHTICMQDAHGTLCAFICHKICMYDDCAHTTYVVC